MKNIQEIAKENKLNLIEISILVHLQREDPEVVLLQDLIDDEKFFGAVTSELDSLVKKGIVKMDSTKHGVACRIV